MNRSSVGAQLLAFAVSFTCLSAATAAETVVSVWPDEAPGEDARDGNAVPRIVESEGRVREVIDPTLTLFSPDPETSNGCAVIICPGGGYNILAVEKEGDAVAEWLNNHGVTAAVLRYRVPRRDPERPYKAPLQDVQRAVRVVRANADEWEIDPGRVGVLGFSAGGNLTVMAGTRWEESSYPASDALDKLSCRPDFLIPIYPAYLGDEKVPDADLDLEIRVTDRTPPAFIAVTADDRNRGTLSAKLFVELRESGVPAELHVFVRGGHGYGLGRPGTPVADWPELCANWMRKEGLLRSRLVD